jgi:hypothetical protein
MNVIARSPDLSGRRGNLKPKNLDCFPGAPGLTMTNLYHFILLHAPSHY